MPLTISNLTARRIWLNAQGLGQMPTGSPDPLAIIRGLGYLQLDTIRNVVRAQDHILWSRNQNYREPMLWPLLAPDRSLFEHFTHDASLLPIETYPYWQLQFRRLGKKTAEHDWYQSGLEEAEIDALRNRIRTEGALSTHAFDTVITGQPQMWSRPPHKKALEQLWYSGELTTAFRRNFHKYYDFAARVIPQEYRADHPTEPAQIDWLFNQALARLKFATPGEMQRFWGVASAREAKTWVEKNEPLLHPVLIECSDRSTNAAFALPDIQSLAEKTRAVCGRMRLLNPFDPAIRDRKRLWHLFGFDYRNEMFVPKKKRKWGYYVYPLLERERFVGRVELKADKNRSALLVTGFWAEPRVKWPKARHQRLQAELARFARFAGLSDVEWTAPRQIEV